MSFKSISACMAGTDRYSDALRTAAAFAEMFGGHLSVLCVGIDRTNPGAYFAGAEAILLQTNIEGARNDAAEAEKAATGILADWVIPWDTVPVIAQLGTLGATIGDGMQLSDLAILPKPYGPDCDTADVAILEAALFQTRVPVLVLPEGQEDWVDPRKVVIAWNQSPEALAAIRGAMSFLGRAEEVEIAIIDPPRHAPDRSDPGGALAQMLSRHGVRVSISVLARSMDRISEVLARHCDDRGADMLVMGAYGHSRLREAILGGATRNMLEIARLPVLMAH